MITLIAASIIIFILCLLAIKQGDNIQSLNTENMELESEVSLYAGKASDMPELQALVSDLTYQLEVGEKHERSTLKAKLDLGREVGRLTNDNKRLSKRNENLEQENKQRRSRKFVDTSNLEARSNEIERLERQLKASEDACRIQHTMMMDWKERAENAGVVLGKSKPANRLIGDDCVATKDSVIKGIEGIVTKSLGWDTSKVQLDELGLQVYGYKDDDTNHILNYNHSHRETYGRVSHLGLSLEELNALHSVMEVVKGNELYW